MKKLILVALILSAVLLANDVDDATKAFKAIGCLTGCDVGDVVDCDYHARIVIDPRQDVKKEKVAKLSQKACDGGDARGCSFLGFLYERGQGVRQDYQKASELFQKACDGGYALGCSNLGYLYERGQGVKTDYQKASEFYQKACNGGNARGCSNLGYLYKNGQGVRQDKSRAKEYLGKACNLGDIYGCGAYNKLNEQGY